MIHSTEAEREKQWQRMHDRYSHSTKEETASYWAAAANRRFIAERRIAKLEAEIAEIEALTCEQAEVEGADELEAHKAKLLRYPRFCLSEQRKIYEEARASAASFEAAFRFEETSDLVKSYGSIFKEKPKPKKRATMTRSRKTSRG